MNYDFIKNNPFCKEKLKVNSLKKSLNDISFENLILILAVNQISLYTIFSINSHSVKIIGFLFLTAILAIIFLNSYLNEYFYKKFPSFSVKKCRPFINSSGNINDLYLLFLSILNIFLISFSLINGSSDFLKLKSIVSDDFFIYFFNPDYVFFNTVVFFSHILGFSYFYKMHKNNNEKIFFTLNS